MCKIMQKFSSYLTIYIQSELCKVKSKVLPRTGHEGPEGE
jgi:hypothetical protein